MLNVQYLYQPNVQYLYLAKHVEQNLTLNDQLVTLSALEVSFRVIKVARNCRSIGSCDLWSPTCFVSAQLNLRCTA